MKSTNFIIRSMIAISMLLSLAILPVTTALAFTVGPYTPGLGSNDPTIGFQAWANPTEISTPGSPYATVSIIHNSIYSNYLKGSLYGFSIPSGASILGIEVSITRMYSGHPNVLDNVVSLVKAGVPAGNNKKSALPWTTSLASVTYGGPTDLWGTTWSPAEVNAEDFGAVLAVYRDNNGVPTSTAYVDSMQVSVYYIYGSSTTVECGDGSPVTYGASVICVATVTRSAGDLTPSGTVDWVSDGNGAFDPNPCTLEGDLGTATCSAVYTPHAVGNGSHLITATYTGDEYFLESSASDDVSVQTRPITITADPKNKVYGDVDPLFTFHITEGSLVFSDTFTGTLTRDPGEDAGVYAILQGSLALPINYLLTYVGNDLTIAKAAPSCTVNEYDVTYDGTEFTATGSCTGVFSEDLLGLDLSQTAHTNVGVYLNDPWTFTDVTGNYSDSTGVVTDTISKRQITIQADTQTKLALQPDPLLTYQVTSGSLLGGDAFSGSLTRLPGEMPGTYPILQGTLTLPDYYAITYLGADLTITGNMLVLTIVMK